MSRRRNIFVSAVPKRPLDIGMIGPRGVGKTSLLAAMYHQLTGQQAGGDLQLTTDDPTGLTARYLQAGLNDLQTIARGLAEPGPGIRPSYESRTLQFKLTDAARLGAGDDRTPHFAKLRWTDYPGEWLFPTATSGLPVSGQQELDERLAQSRALLIAVDAPAVMWRGGELNSQINAPLMTREIVLNKWLTGAADTDKTLVIFTPLKCERWVRTEQSRASLEQAVRAANETLVRDLLALHSAPQVYYMPVQTVGSLEFERYRGAADARSQAVFRGRPRAEMQPRWVDNPLKAVLIDAAEHVNTSEGLFDWLLGRNQKVRSQLQQWLAAGYDQSVVRWG